MNARLAFIAAHMAEHAVRLMCRVLGVSRSWFHAWRRAAPTRAERATRREVLVAEIREIFEASRQRYGRPSGSRRSSGPGTTDIQADGRQADEPELHSAALQEAPRAHHHRQSARARRGAKPARPQLRDHRPPHGVAG